MLRHNLIFVTAALAVSFMAAPAVNAQVTSSFSPGTMGFQPLETAFDDFNGYTSVNDDTHLTYTGDVGFYTGTTSGIAALPSWAAPKSPWTANNAWKA